MKRILVLAAAALVASFLADGLRAELVRLIDPQSTTVLVSTVLAYALPFAVAGALIAVIAKAFASGLVCAIAMGLLVVAFHIASDGIRPVLAYSHGPWWQDALGWANVYAPVVGALVGAAGMGRMHIRSENAA